MGSDMCIRDSDWGEHPGGNERAVAPTGVKGPGGESAPDNMLLYAPGPGFDPIRSTFSLFIADYMHNWVLMSLRDQQVSE